LGGRACGREILVGGEVGEAEGGVGERVGGRKGKREMKVEGQGGGVERWRAVRGGGGGGGGGAVGGVWGWREGVMSGWRERWGDVRG